VLYDIAVTQESTKRRKGDMPNDESIVKNAIHCGICQAPADRYDWGFLCRANPNHMGDLIVGIFSDLTYPERIEKEG
jgi:hypothetical protein